MAQVYGHQISGKTERPLLASRLFRLLFCVFLFTAAAVCKNILPAEYRQALVVGLDSGMTFRDVLEAFGESASSQEVFSRLWSDSVLKVFGLADEGQEVSGSVSGTAEAPEVSDTASEPRISKRLDSFASLTIPVVMRSEISLDAGELPASPATVPAAAPADPDASEAPEDPADEPQPGCVISEAYRIPEKDRDLPLPEVVSTEATAISFPYVTPVYGTLTSVFGYREHPIDGEYKFHYGVDIAVPTGTEVACFTDGTVSFAGWGDINGNYIKVEHDGGFVTLYAHLDTILVETGERVQTGETIARSGETGEVSGPHLHFQIYHNGKLIDPAPFLEFAA